MPGELADAVAWAALTSEMQDLLEVGGLLQSLKSVPDQGHHRPLPSSAQFKPRAESSWQSSASCPYHRIPPRSLQMMGCGVLIHVLSVNASALAWSNLLMPGISEHVDELMKF